MSETTPVEVAHDLGHYLRPMRRHVPLIASIMAIALILGVGLAVLKKPSYTATARVLVQANIIDQVNSQTSTQTATKGTVNMDNELQVAQSLPTAQTAATILDNGTTPGKLLGRLTVTVPPNTLFLKFSYSAKSTSVAIAGADALANAYLQNREAAAKTYQTDRLDTLNHQLNQLQNQLNADQTAYNNATPHTPTARKFGSRITSDQGKISNLNPAISVVQQGSTVPGQLQATAALGGSSPNQGRAILVLAFLVIGALAAVGGAAARERLDKTVRYEDDLNRDGVRLIAEIKAASRGTSANSQSLNRSRAVQRIAASIGAALGDSGGSIYLAELSDSAIADHLDEQLAAELSRFGSTTEIVTLGAVPPAHRTTGELEGVPELDDAPAAIERGSNGAGPEIDPGELTDADHHASSEMLGWPMPGNAVAVVETPRPPAVKPVPKPKPAPAKPFDPTASLLQQVQVGLSRARYVILSSVEAPQGSDAYVLASLSQVAVIVAEVGVTERVALTEVVEQIEITPSRVLGGLLWRPPSGRGRRGR